MYGFFQHQELLKNEYYKSNLSHFLFKMESVNAFTYTSTIEKKKNQQSITFFHR